MTGNLFIALGAIALGAIARVWLPYIETLRDSPGASFDRKFLVPPLVSCVIALITLPLVFGSLPSGILNQITLQTIGILFVAGWGATDIAREGQKTITRS